MFIWISFIKVTFIKKYIHTERERERNGECVCISKCVVPSLSVKQYYQTLNTRNLTLLKSNVEIVYLVLSNFKIETQIYVPFAVIIFGVVCFFFFFFNISCVDFSLAFHIFGLQPNRKKNMLLFVWDHSNNCLFHTLQMIKKICVIWNWCPGLFNTHTLAQFSAESIVMVN